MPEEVKEISCPCGSGKSFEACCGPLLEGTRVAETGEELVRSRYTAFTRKNYDYIVATTHPDFRQKEYSAEALAESGKGVRWLRLQILDTAPVTGGGEGETVSFVAYYEFQGVPYQLAETSYFRRHEDRLYYVEGTAHKPVGYRREGPKIGRNDPCPCGSGKKYKKCCGKNEQGT